MTAEYRYTSPEAGEHVAYLLPPLLRLIGHARPLDVVDLGCGNGSIAHAIARLGHRVTGIDASASAIHIATVAYPECRFYQATVAQLPDEMQGAKFDVVVSAETIEHLVDPRALLRTAQELLRPDGTLVLTTPYHGYLKNLALAVTGRLDDHFTALWDGGHVKFFSPRTLRAMLDQEGFRDIRLHFAGRVPWLWKSMIAAARPDVRRAGP